MQEEPNKVSKLTKKEEQEEQKKQRRRQKKLDDEIRRAAKLAKKVERKQERDALKLEKQKEEEELKQYLKGKKYETELSIDMLMKALDIEQEHSRRLYNRYSQSNVKVQNASAGEYCYRSKSYPPSDPEKLSLVLCASDGTDIRGRIKSYDPVNSHVYFSTFDEVDISKDYCVKYENSYVLTHACQNALETIRIFNVEGFFKTFDASGIEVKPKRKIKEPKKWFNKSIANDVLQKETVKNILTESAYPLPFVVLGGPGTGKTSVIVETAVQILELKSFARVLITCQSNSACDEVGIRLLAFLPSVKVFRYYAYSYFTTRFSQTERTQNPNKDSYFEKLSMNSTIQSLNGLYVGEYRNVSTDDLKKYKIVIATMSTVHVMMEKHDLKDHFDFIFVDECCAATEPECLIPIVGLGFTQKKVHSNIILVGDSKLLGPVVLSSKAKDLGLKQSLLERITKMSLYDPENPDNKKRVVKFTNNYRSHPEIFKYSNETFYNNSMEPMISVAEHNFAKDWKQLPNPGIPVIFHATHSKSAGESDGTSVFNVHEVEIVFDYVKNLMEIGFDSNRKVKQEQIGIASPYLAQVKKLKARLENYSHIDIGTTEFFQGREKPIMIISAVKTQNLNENIDFLDDPRRLNVLLTRAKSLLIIVGNLQKLYRFPSWEPFITHCYKSGLTRQGLLRDEPDDKGLLMEKVTMPRFNNESSESEEETSSD